MKSSGPYEQRKLSPSAVLVLLWAKTLRRSGATSCYRHYGAEPGLPSIPLGSADNSDSYNMKTFPSSTPGSSSM